MKNETSDIHKLREKMSRFNAWELSYAQTLSEEERFRQFLELFELGMSCDSATVERAHREHQLVRISRALQEGSNKG